MKKDYIQPEVKEVKLIVPTILAGSTTEAVDQEGLIEEDSDIA